jgi:sarcosine oxidase delta subunit
VVPGGAYVNSPAKENSMNCPHCHKHISPKLICSAAAKLNRSKQTAVPKPKILTPCPHCGELRGVRELRAHRPVCPKNPRVLRHAIA